MEAALRRRLAGVAEVSISQEEQKATVTFVPGTRGFSAAEFRGAVAEANVDVVGLELEVCGVVDGQHTLDAAIDASPRLRIEGRRGAASDRVCVVGRLDESVTPYALRAVAGRPEH